jgi:hypothetical protein
MIDGQPTNQLTDQSTAATHDVFFAKWKKVSKKQTKLDKTTNLDFSGDLLPKPEKNRTGQRREKKLEVTAVVVAVAATVDLYCAVCAKRTDG